MGKKKSKNSVLSAIADKMIIKAASSKGEKLEDVANECGINLKTITKK